MPASRAKSLKKRARQRQVEILLASGVRSQRVIAERLQVSEATVSRDITTIEQQWAAMAKGETKDLWRARHHRMLDDLLMAVVPTARGLAPRREDGTTEAIPRRDLLAAQKAVLDILDMRNKLEGLYAPTTLNLGPLPDDVQRHMQEADAEGPCPELFGQGKQ